MRRRPRVAPRGPAPYGRRVTSSRRGIGYGAGAYALWGIFPLYFTLLEPASPMEILTYRIVWSLLVCVIALATLRRLSNLRSVTPHQFRLLASAGVLLSLNWLTFVYGVTTDQVVEASLGYFINPLVTVALGVVVLGERLNRPQIVALAVAGAAVVILTVNYGRIPWIALTLALSFAFYGLLKKKAGVGALESLTLETAVLFLPATGWLVWLGATGTQTFTGYGTAHALLLIGLGVITTAPLLLFGAAATRIPLTTLGLLQYIAPVLQFLIGVVLLGEPMPTVRWIGFALVWLALAIFTADMLQRTRRAGPALADTPGADDPEAAAIALQAMTAEQRRSPEDGS